MSSPKEALAIYVARRIRAHDVIDLLADVMIERGIAEHLRSDNELSSKASAIAGAEHPRPVADLATRHSKPTLRHHSPSGLPRS